LETDLRGGLVDLEGRSRLGPSVLVLLLTLTDVACAGRYSYREPGKQVAVDANCELLALANLDTVSEAASNETCLSNQLATIGARTD
jgi:hypothetical protein